MERDSFVFYRSFTEAIKCLPDCERLHAYEAIITYALDGIELEVEGLAKAIFTMAKPQLDANNRRYENGKKGGAPKGNQNARKEKQPKNNLELTKKQPNVNVNVNVNDNVNDNENVNDNDVVSIEERMRKTAEQARRFFNV